MFGFLKKKVMSICDCKGKISICDHTKHGAFAGFGKVKNFTGGIWYRSEDVAWQCVGCGMPLYAIKKGNAENETRKSEEIPVDTNNHLRGFKENPKGWDKGKSD